MVPEPSSDPRGTRFPFGDSPPHEPETAERKAAAVRLSPLDKFVATFYNVCSDKERGEPMSPLKKGSKLTDTPKDIMLRTRIDQDTAEKLEIVAEKLNMTKSAVVRKGILEQFENLEEK